MFIHTKRKKRKRRLRGLISAVVIIGLITSITGAAKHSEYQKLNDDTTEAYQEVDEQYKEKMDLLPSFLSSASKHINPDNPLIKESLSLLKNVDYENMSGEDKEKLNNSLNSKLSELYKIIDSSKSANSDKTLKNKESQLKETEEELSKAKDNLGKTIEKIKSSNSPIDRVFSVFFSINPKTILQNFNEGLEDFNNSSLFNGTE